MATSTSPLALATLLADAADTDTVYRDVYLRRGATLLEHALTEPAFREREQLQREADDLATRGRAATFRRDWSQVAELATRAERLRTALADTAAVAAVAARVYDAAPVVLDPFSPGLGVTDTGREQRRRRDQLVEHLQALGAGDAPRRTFYAARRAHVAALAIAGGDEPQETGRMDRARMEQLAVEAAERGDARRLRELAEALAKSEAASTGAAGSAGVSRAQDCPVDLAVAFPAEVVERARALGLRAVRTEPILNVGALLDLVHAHAWQAGPADEQTEREGIVRAEALVAAQDLPAGVSGDLKVLAGQFLMHRFVNSGGARYLMGARPETALVEDFPETAPPAGGLLEALGLPRRQGLSRAKIERTLLRRGEAIVAGGLGLDSLEFRLVCIPYDLYVRVGREAGWGQQPRWTHFDGYQVGRGWRLRALAGGDARYGGLLDLMSLSPTDARDEVVARFAVVRRARMVARWR